MFRMHGRIGSVIDFYEQQVFCRIVKMQMNRGMIIFRISLKTHRSEMIR